MKKCLPVAMTVFLAASLLGSTNHALAAPALRKQVTQKGDFLFIGNTLGYECAANTPVPVVGTIANNACSSQTNNNIADSAPDLYWRSDSPAAGQATASTAETADTARSTAVLTVPTGASVTHAFLYWGATAATGAADTQVTLERTGAGGFSQSIEATQSFVPGTNNAYQAVADVTSIVQVAGSGAYRVSGVSATAFANVNNSNVFAAWALVVFYERASDPLRTIAVFDGLDAVYNGNPQSAMLTGFRVPNANWNAKLGVIAYEGDNTTTGDSLQFNGTAIADAVSPGNNFFNGSRSYLGSPVSVAGDLPQLTGGAQSMAGVDLDVVDVTGLVTAGATSATLSATSTGDTYYLGAFITSVSTFVPVFATTTKTVRDVDGSPTIPGDTLEYVIEVENTGNDASVDTSLSDVVPSGVTYVPGSLKVDGSAKTDSAGDDEASYDAATKTLAVRLGTGANASNGGSIAPGSSTTVIFRVTVDKGFSGSLANQALVTAAGALGAPSSSTPTDGDSTTEGSSPTTILVDACATNANCVVPTPVCSKAHSPAICVQCLADSDCGGTESGLVCDVASETCMPGCRGTNGNGCAAGLHCSSTDDTVGACDKCLTNAHCMNPTPVCSDTNECTHCASNAECEGNTTGTLCALEGTLEGSCVQCTATDKTSCTGSTATCDETTGTCVQCTSDDDCSDPAKKRCDTTAHTCVACLGDECNDAGAPDASTPDASVPDASAVTPVEPTTEDAGAEDEHDVGATVDHGCGCRTVPSGDFGARGALGGVLLALGVMGARRTRRATRGIRRNGEP